MEQPPAPDLSQAYVPPPSGGIPIWVWPIACCGCGVFPVMILAAILFPVYAQAREAARQTACMSNEKHMALGVTMYSQDYDETMPPAKQWMDVISPYAKEDDFHCPSVSRDGVGNYGYAFDQSLNYKSLDKIPEPKIAKMIFDSTLFTRNSSDSGASLPSPGRHRKRNDIAYVDGHVQASGINSSGEPAAQ